MNPSFAVNNNETASTGTLFNEVAQLKSIKQPNQTKNVLRPPKMKEQKIGKQIRNWRASLHSNQKLHELLYTLKSYKTHSLKELEKSLIKIKCGTHTSAPQYTRLIIQFVFEVWVNVNTKHLEYSWRFFFKLLLKWTNHGRSWKHQHVTSNRKVN